jgi:uncharacterized protein YhaN
MLDRTEPAGREIEERLESFRRGCENALKYYALSSEIRPTDLLPARRLAELRTRADWCRARLREMQTADPALAQHALPPSPRNELLEQLEQARARRERFRLARINAFSECDRAVEAWRREGPGIEAEIRRLEALKADLEEFSEATRIAHAELSTIAEVVFTQWAAALNRRVNEILPSITSRYRDAAFSDELELSLYSEEAGRRLEPRELEHLSKGVRDQINLAVRVAVSEHLSAHVGKLPLVFDEPFAHWDDTRFVEGMRFLADLAARHQIILLSCHQWRYAELERAYPEVAARLNLCSLVEGAGR